MNVKSIAMGVMGFVIRGAILALIILAIYRTGQKAYDFGFRIFTEEAMSPEPGRDVSVTIVQGDSVMDVGKSFEEKGLIRDAKLFYVQKKCSEYDNDIKPGFYTLNTSMTAEDMFAIIAGRSDEEGSVEDDEDIVESEATPLTEANPLVEQTGDWEGSEEQEADLENPEGADAGDSADASAVKTIELRDN